MDSVHIEQCHNADDVLDTLVRSRTELKSFIEYITVYGRRFDHSEEDSKLLIT
jgi:hypothetical protein